MSLKSEVDEIFAALVESGNIRETVYPIGAPVAIVSDNAAAAWDYPAADLHIEIQAAGLLPADPCWLVGVVFLANDLAVGCFADLAIGIGADAPGIDRAEFSFYNELAAAAGVVAPVFASRCTPIKIEGNPRLAGRIRWSAIPGVQGISVKVIIATAIGT